MGVVSHKYLVLRRLFAVFALSIFSLSAFAINVEDDSVKHESKGFDFGSMIIHHVLDDYQWHFFDSDALGIHATIPLPIIVYHPEQGLDIFSASRLAHGQEYKGYYFDHGKLIHKTAGDEDLSHSASLLQPTGHVFYDFSLTKNFVSMMISAILMLIIFLSIANRYKKGASKTPRGLQSFMEPIILFVRDEVAKPTLGQKYHKYLPFLLTIFFFIWINNMLGLLPGAANVTGNIAVTFVLALLTFLITTFSANKHYWKHIFAPPGIPIFLLPIMWVVEILGMFTKPFALMVRLFANINAGHMIILSIIGLIFVFGQLAEGLGLGMSIISIAFTLFMYFLELLVAAVQAYIFTILSALFIGQAIEEVHHESEGAEGAHH